MKSKQRKWKRKAFTAAVLAGTLTLGGLPVHAFSDESGLNAIEEQIPETDPSDIPEAEPGGYLADEYDLNAPESFYAETDIRTDEEELLLGDSEIPAAYPEDPEEVLTALPPVRSQYSETCWAFSAVGNAEIGRIMNGTRDTAVDFSELALVYSNYHLLTDPLGGTAGDAIEITTGQSYLDIGGTYSFAWNTLMGWWGVLEEQDLPFQSETISMLKQNGWSSEAAQNDTVRLHTVRNMNRHTNRDAIKRAIMSGGAVSGSVYSGTYSGNSLYNASTKAYYSDHSCGTNHAVLIVGWDDSFSADNFAVKPPADGAWLVRNSWGEQAIDYSGYYWLSYEDQSAASAFYSCEFVENDSFYDRNYQYDGCRYSKNIVPSSEGTPLVAANVFDVKSAAEELKAVMVSIGSADSVCTVRIYTGLTDSADPESGELKAETTTNVDFAGYYTMELPEAVALAGGEKYSVVVEVSCASGKPSIGVEKTATVNGISHTASIKAGQSFSKAAGSSKYTDLIKNKNSWGNLRIKAFTDVVDDRPAPEPTASPEPTATPEPTKTPKPTATPTPTAAPAPTENPAVPMYRLYNPNSGEHFYTAVEAERKVLVSVGWQAEGIGWYAPRMSKSAVYRMYNPNAGDHHYTMSASERDFLVKAGWNYEGIGWYSDTKKTIPLYRQYNPNAQAGSHNYTTSAAERDFLVKAGWQEEGIGWYGCLAR